MQTRTRQIALQLIAAAITGLLFTGVDDRTGPVITVGAFSEATGTSPLTDGWTSVNIHRQDPTRYTLVDIDGTRVLRAQSNDAASGLSKAIDVDPAAYPVIQWTWRVANLLERGDLSRKRGDDFAARLFVTFDYDPANLPLNERLKYKTYRLLGYDEVPVRALNYVWANQAPAGTVADNAHTSWVKMIVLRSKDAELHRWYTEKRNVYADYRAVFGEEPPAITSITLMTDTDNTGESATAYFGDIHLLPAQ